VWVYLRKRSQNRSYNDEQQPKHSHKNTHKDYIKSQSLTLDHVRD
jgi:hypothetical protein